MRPRTLVSNSLASRARFFSALVCFTPLPHFGRLPRRLRKSELCLESLLVLFNAKEGDEKARPTIRDAQTMYVGLRYMLRFNQSYEEHSHYHSPSIMYYCFPLEVA